MSVVKFISYDEGISLYCDGILTLNIEGTEWKFGNHAGCDFSKFWTSGGSWDTDGNVTTGPWQINKLDKEEILEEFNKIFVADPYKLLEECIAIMNENVNYGCCGECV